MWCFLYESAGLTLENVDIMYNDPLVKPWTSGRWAPPGYNSRREAVEERKNKQVDVAPDESGLGMGAEAGVGNRYRGGKSLGDEERAENV